MALTLWQSLVLMRHLQGHTTGEEYLDISKDQVSDMAQTLSYSLCSCGWGDNKDSKACFYVILCYGTFH